MPTKTKTPQKQDLNNAQSRDFFQTPNYAVDLLVPFLKKLVPIALHKNLTVWECAAGERKITKRLQNHFDVVSTDIQDSKSFNFLTDDPKFDFDCIVTNTPFSLKKKFYETCVKYNTPFALLIPADYSLWLIDAVNKYGCEKIIPERRIDYITPNTLKRIWWGETWENVGITDKTVKEFAEDKPLAWEKYLSKYSEFNFSSIYDAPAHLLRKYSSSDFHSMWLTRGLNLGRTETFVELTNKMKDNI